MHGRFLYSIKFLNISKKPLEHRTIFFNIYIGYLLKEKKKEKKRTKKETEKNKQKKPS